MQVTLTIHEAWLARPDDLRRVMALLAGLEIPPPGTAARPIAEPHDPREDLEERFDPEEQAPAPARSRWTGDDDEAQARDDEDAPTDGRQLLGWASKQQPDAKGLVMSYGKKKGFPSKIVTWTAEQVSAAYRYAWARSTTR
jgi:hypothetical protein